MRTNVSTSVPTNESSSTVLACLFSCSLTCGWVSRPRFRPLNRNTHACNNLSTHTATHTHGSCTLSNSFGRRAFFFLFFLSDATQRESAQVIVFVAGAKPLQCARGGGRYMDGWLNICGDGHQLVAGGQISKHDKDQRREEENKKEKEKEEEQYYSR